MATVRRIFLLGMLLLMVGRALAQSPQFGPFIDQLEALVGRRDINAAAKHVESNPQVAQEVFLFMAYALNTMEPEVQQEAVLMLNVIARTFQIRLGNAEMAQLLAKNGKGLADSAWQGSVLAGGGPVTPPGPVGGPTLENPANPQVASDGAGVDPELVAMTCLALGNFIDAESMLRQALAQRPGPGAERRLKRQIAACRLGQGLPNEALQQVEELLKTPSDAHEKLASELLASQCAYTAALREKLNQHVKKARPLASSEPDPYGPVARYLLESYQLQIDLVGNPELSVDDIMQRHARCQKELKSFKPASRVQLAPFTSELYWPTDVYYNTWIWTVGSAKLRPGETSDPRLKAIWPGLNQLFELGPALGKLQHFEFYFSNIAYFENRIDDFLSDGDLAHSQPELKTLETKLPSLYQLFQESQKAVGTFPVSTSRGTISRLMARLYQLKARQSVIEAQTRYPDELRRAVEEDLSRADSFAEQADNIDSHLNNLRTRLGYLQSAQPANWQQVAQDCLNTYAKIPGATAGRLSQFTLYSERGKLLLAQGRVDEAAVELQKAVDTLEADLRDSGSSASRSQSIRREFRQLYEDLARTHAQQGKSGEAFQTLDRLQQVESSGNFKLQDLQKRVRGGDVGTIKQAGEAQARIQASEHEVVALMNAKADQSRIDRATQLLANNRSAYYGCVSDLEKKYPEFRKLDIKPINFSKLQRSIPANTLVVQYFASQDELYILEASRENVMVRKVTVGKAELQRLVRDFRQRVLMHPQNPESFSWADPDGAALKKTMTDLYGYLITPVEADLAGKETLAVIPFDFLLYLPFQALASEAGGKLQFLIEKKQLVVICKAADLDQVFGAPASKTGSLVAFGDPDGTLPGAGEEVKAIKDIFPGSKFFLTANATNDQLKNVQAPAVSYLHFATHGMLNIEDPRLSYLTMGQGNKLFVSDIVGYRLDGPTTDLNLVTLSACQTALGELNHDGSDLRSLADAFSLAGSRSVVASLWSVEDQSTRDLMVEFYSGLKAGKSKALALQEAQVHLLTQGKYGHPFYWAPFILIGDWR